MNETLFEPFLIQFYLLDSVLDGFITEKERSRIFYELADVFCLKGERELKEYERESRNPQFDRIKNLAAYERLCRTVEFAQRSGQTVELTHRDRMILAKKREAMVIRDSLFRQGKNLTRETLSSSLLNMAMNGSVDAMTTLAYLEYHGICVCQDRHNALKRIRICAKWNNLFGNLMGIAYDEGREDYFHTLYTVLRNAGQKRVLEEIFARKGFAGEPRKIPAARLVERAFGLGIVKREYFDPVFAKVAFSEIVSYEDKQKLLLNRQKDAIAALSDLPVDLKRENAPTLREDCVKKIPLYREAESRKILRNLTVAALCPPEAYTPLMVVAPDEAIEEMYVTMIREGLGESSVVELDAGTLRDQDFAGNRENVLLRGLSETKSTRTVFLIKHCEELEEGRTEEIAQILDHSYRRKFKLFQPPVSLDLSDLVFVLFASEENRAVSELSRICDTVRAAGIRPEEKTALTESIFRDRARSFGYENIVLEEEAGQELARLAVQRLRKIVDTVLQNAIFEKKETVTRDDVRAAYREHAPASSARGFGYVGGKIDAKN